MSDDARATTDARLRRARAWFDDGPARPPWADVELVVRLQVDDAALLDRLLVDAVSMRADWVGLTAALAEVTSAPSVGGDRTPSSDGAVAKSGEEPSGTAGARLRALRQWIEQKAATGTDVASDLQADDLRKLAENPPADRSELVRRFRSNVRKYEQQILDVLSSVADDEPSTALDEVAPVLKPPERTDRVESEVPVEVGEDRSNQGGSPASPDSVPPAQSGSVRPVDFAHFDFVLAAERPTEPGVVRFDATGEESLRLTWDRPGDAAAVEIFSVVTNAEYLPKDSPGFGHVVASTLDTTADDTSEFTRPVRYVAVWRSSGSSEEQARASQPQLWAVGQAVLPVRNCTVRVDEGRVIGNWTPIDGAERFDVYRVPAVRDGAVAQNVDVQHQLPATAVTNGGFTDRGATPGRSYEYQVFAVAPVDGIDRWSPSVSRTVTIEAVAERVLDLEVAPSSGSETTFDLSWTTPAIGDVEVYRSEAPPFSGIDHTSISRFILESQGGLVYDLRLDQARDHEEGRVYLRDVPWPQGWSRAYFTPVTVVHEDLIQVGRTQSLTRAAAPTEVRLVERVDSEFLTFAWPLGAPTVRIYQTPSSRVLIDPATEHAILDVSQEDYAKYGGAHLPHPLPAEGCAVHLVGVAYSRGRATYSAPITIQYPGLIRIRYRFEGGGAEPRGRRDAPTTARRVSAASQVSHSLDLVLVHNARRLPLHALDGVEVARRHVSLESSSQVVFDPVDTTGRSGYLRVFAGATTGEPRPVAVLDPPLRDLTLGEEPEA